MRAEGLKVSGIYIQPHVFHYSKSVFHLFRFVVIDLYACSREAGGGDDGCSGQHGNLLDYGGLFTMSG